MSERKGHLLNCGALLSSQAQDGKGGVNRSEFRPLDGSADLLPLAVPRQVCHTALKAAVEQDPAILVQQGHPGGRCRGRTPRAWPGSCVPPPPGAPVVSEQTGACRAGRLGAPRSPNRGLGQIAAHTTGCAGRAAPRHCRELAVSTDSDERVLPVDLQGDTFGLCRQPGAESMTHYLTLI
jgi:hypothetical protein